MLCWFKSKPYCPIDDFQRLWVEDRFVWLINEFGIRKLLSVPVLLPNRQNFPYMCCVSNEEIFDQMVLVAKYMGMDLTRLHLNFYKGKERTYRELKTDRTNGFSNESNGCFQLFFKEPIWSDAQYFLPELIHEIGFVMLMGQRGMGGCDDRESLVNLLSVFLGMGVISANSSIQEITWTHALWYGWSAKKFSYITMEMYGYALALFALYRSEPKPTWQSKLRPDVRTAFKKSIRFLQDTSVSTFSFPTGITGV